MHLQRVPTQCDTLSNDRHSRWQEVDTYVPPCILGLCRCHPLHRRSVVWRLNLSAGLSPARPAHKDDTFTILCQFPTIWECYCRLWIETPLVTFILAWMTIKVTHFRLEESKLISFDKWVILKVIHQTKKKQKQCSQNDEDLLLFYILYDWKLNIILLLVFWTVDQAK